MPHLSTVFRVTDEDVLVVPAETPHDDRHVSQVYDTFALLPALRLIDEALGGARDPFASCSCAKRSPLLTELVATYFEERIRANLRPEPRREWTKNLIISEVAKAVFGDSATSKQNLEAGDSRLLTSSIVERALRFIEANLFGNVDALTVARAAAASRSSLLRHYRHEVGESLGAYVQGRRLDEAQRLLERRGLTVAEVALLVGYQNAGAFAEAYRRRFGVPPSSRHTSP